MYITDIPKSLLVCSATVSVRMSDSMQLLYGGQAPLPVGARALAFTFLQDEIPGQNFILEGFSCSNTLIPKGGYKCLENIFLLAGTLTSYPY